METPRRSCGPCTFQYKMEAATKTYRAHGSLEFDTNRRAAVAMLTVEAEVEVRITRVVGCLL